MTVSETTLDAARTLVPDRDLDAIVDAARRIEAWLVERRGQAANGAPVAAALRRAIEDVDAEAIERDNVTMLLARADAYLDLLAGA